MIITIHQPEFLSYLGFFDKISKADGFVIADSFQVKKNYYDNRNKIRANNPQGWHWITIPISSDNHKSFREVEVAKPYTWHTKILNAIEQNYHRSQYFEQYFPRIKEIICKKYDFLFDYNFELLCQMLIWFDIKTPLMGFTSLLNLESVNGSDKCLEICQKSDADTYLSGSSGKDYLNLDSFEKNNIKVVFHEFEHPIYKQVYEPFIPGMSAIDYLFNHVNKNG